MSEQKLDDHTVEVIVRLLIKLVASSALAAGAWHFGGWYGVVMFVGWALLDKREGK